MKGKGANRSVSGSRASAQRGKSASALKRYQAAEKREQSVMKAAQGTPAARAIQRLEVAEGKRK